MKDKILHLTRLALAHTYRGIRALQDPDKSRYHAAVVQECRLRIDYINKELTQ